MTGWSLRIFVLIGAALVGRTRAGLLLVCFESLGFDVLSGSCWVSTAGFLSLRSLSSVLARWTLAETFLSAADASLWRVVVFIHSLLHPPSPSLTGGVVFTTLRPFSSSFHRRILFFFVLCLILTIFSFWWHIVSLFCSIFSLSIPNPHRIACNNITPSPQRYLSLTARPLSFSMHSLFLFLAFFRDIRYPFFEPSLSTSPPSLVF